MFDNNVNPREQMQPMQSFGANHHQLVSTDAPNLEESPTKYSHRSSKDEDLPISSSLHQQSDQVYYYGHSKSPDLNMINSDYGDDPEEDHFDQMRTTMDKQNVGEDSSQIYSTQIERFEKQKSYQREKDRQNVDEEQEQTELFIWGKNDMGQLGLNPDSNSVLKVHFQIKIDQLKIRQISCGKHHTLLLSDKGSLYSMGSNLLGQLGLGDSSTSKLFSPTLIESLSMWPCKKVSSSKYSSFALMENGEVFSWGSCLHGILGIGEVSENQYFPIKIVVEEEQTVVVNDISAGKNHAGILVSSSVNGQKLSLKKQFYVWGQNKQGQLGTWDYEDRYSPSPVDLDFDPQELQFGENFSVVADHQSDLFMCGTNLKGELGTGQTYTNSNSFQKVKGLPNMEIVKIVCGAFVSCLFANGDLYIWGSTPLCQLNIPQKFQQLLNIDRQISDICVGKSFCLINDSQGNLIQVGGFNEKDKSSQVVQTIENVRLSQLYCGYDFAICEVQNTQDYYQSVQSKVAFNSKTADRLQKTPQASSRKQQQQQMNPKNAYNHQNIVQFQTTECSCSPSPMKTTKILDQSNITKQSQFNLNSVKREPKLQDNNQQLHNSSMQVIMKEIKHQQSCTPMRDLTPSNTRNVQNQSSSNTPNLRLRLPNHNNNNTSSNPYYAGGFSQFDDTLNQTLVTTPQQLRKTMGVPQQQTNAHPLFSNLQTTPPPANNMYFPPQFSVQQNQSMLNQSYHGCPSIYQSMDNFNQYPYGGAGLNQTYNPFEIVIKEKQELQHQLNVEIQRRLLLEKDVNEMYRQLEQLRTGQGGVIELNKHLEQTNKDYQNLIMQSEEDQCQNQKLKQQLSLYDQEFQEMKKVQEEIMHKNQQQQKEIEFLKSKVEVEQRKYEERSHLTSEMTKSKDIDEQVQRKAKEIYDLTVQLGCLKEENFQMKKEKEIMSEDFQERLRDQQLRAEADLVQAQEELEQLRGTIEQYKDIAVEVQQIKKKQEVKNQQMHQLQQESEKKSLELSEKTQKLDTQKKEMSAMKSVQEKLVKEINKLREELSVSKLENKVKEQVIEKQFRQREDKLKQQQQQIIKDQQQAMQPSNPPKSILQAKSQNRQQLVLENNEGPDTKKTHSETPLEKKAPPTSNNFQPSEHFEKTQRQFNPIETPLDSERTPKEGKKKRVNSKEFACSRVDPMQQLAAKRNKGSSKTQADISQIQQTQLEKPRSTNMIPTATSKSPIHGQTSRAQAQKSQNKSQIQNNENSINKSQDKNNKSLLNSQPKHQDKIYLQQIEEPEPIYGALDNDQREDEGKHTPNYSSSAVKTNLLDMRHKLNDIQNNKTFLEKKIHEYEKKLVELKGGPADQKGEGTSQKKGGQKINTLTATVIEKVLSDARK